MMPIMTSSYIASDDAINKAHDIMHAAGEVWHH